MTFNIRHGEAGAARLGQVIRAADSDIVCLQETNAFRHLPDPVPRLTRELPGYHIVRHGELMTASRLPVVSHAVRPLGVRRTRRPALETLVDVGNGRRVTVLNAHLATFVTGASLARRRDGESLLSYLRGTGAIRREQVNAVRERVASVQTPLVIAGDFNTPPRGLAYRILPRVADDAWARRGAGLGWTFPADRPQMRIDYVWTAHGASARRVSVSPAGLTSDHRAVIAEMVLP
jgi:vancomycin resistance protein VanJ